ncbi:MAG: FAD-dependent tricarballylate dehydrogenase TcuA [Nocardiopsaceae bacterium]|nr:FAD-dependent tricarballylate dehydrogenase TcuA [Nocardiopsaceae bacterium]
MITEPSWDVVVIGGGNAGLVAAMAARRHVPRVLLLERASAAMRGGNTRHTRNVRCVHDQGDDYTPGTYSFDELWRDLCAVGTGPANEQLAELTVAESATLPAWMSEHGIRWQRPLAGTLHLGRTNRFFLGGGKALVNAYHRTAAGMGVATWYEATAEDLVMDGDRAVAVTVVAGGQRRRVPGRAFVCASGGFEANTDWLRRYWGDAADSFIIRGTRDNDGKVLAALLEAGAQKAGEERGFHAVAVDARAPRFDGGIATRLDSIPFSVVVNSAGRRFYDEGQEIWPKRYAIWGSNIAGQPGQIAYSLWDAKVSRLFLPPMYGPASAPDVPALASALGLDPEAVTRTVDEYNKAVVPGGRFDPGGLDECHTDGLDPPKSHWARPLDTPPYYGIAMRPGITFTYMGIAVTADARVRTADGAFENVFAAGEIMSGNILSTGYLAGFGMTIGGVWGRIAGRGAARVASGGTSGGTSGGSDG